MSGGVHTSAQHQRALDGMLLEYCGTVASAHVCVAPVGEPPQLRPVLEVLVLHGTHRIKARQVYTEGTRPQAEALAARLQPGTPVALSHPAHGMALSLPWVQHIAPGPAPERC